MNNYAEVKDFHCIHTFTEEVVNELLDHDSDEDCYTINIIAKERLTKDLIKLLLSIESEDVSFDIGSIDIDDIEMEYYDREYMITIDSDYDLYCEPIYRDGDYIVPESDSTYIYQNSSFEILKEIKFGNKIIFGFEEED